MTERTRIYGVVLDSNGAPVVGQPVTAKLTDPEMENGQPVPRLTTAVTDENGRFELLLWPNNLGWLDSCYTFRVGSLLLDGFVPSPDVGPVELWRIAVLRDGCVICGKNCPTNVPTPQLLSEGWYADIQAEGLYGEVDTTGLYAQIETAVLTSKPYPVEAVEAVTMGAMFIAGNLAFKLVNPIESIDLGATLVAGELRTLLKTTATDESLDLAAVFVSGQLLTLLKTTAADESVDLGAVFVGGVLTEVGRVFVTIPAEEMTLSATFISGELL